LSDSRTHVEISVVGTESRTLGKVRILGIRIDPDQHSLETCSWQGCGDDGSHGTVRAQVPLTVVFFRKQISALCPLHYEALKGVEWDE
jgi:hypothetical protein